MNWYHYLLIVLLSLILFALLFILIVSNLLVSYVVYPKREMRDETKKRDADLYWLDFSEKREKVIFTLRDGYQIHADIVRQSDKYAIFSHGYSSNREGMVKYAQEFYDLGFSLLLYDQRGHGDNKREKVKMGYREKEDLHEIILKLKEMEGDISFGIVGESMGASIALMSLSYDDGQEFIVADCPYSSLTDLFKYKIKQFHLPFFFFNCADFFMNLRYGYHFSDVSPKDDCAKKDVPLLIVDGESDDYIPIEESKVIYDSSISQVKELHYIKGAKHARSYRTDSKLYRRILEDFLRRIKQV